MILEFRDAVLVGQKAYDKKDKTTKVKTGDGFRYLFVANGEVVDAIGDKDLKDKISDLAKEQVRLGTAKLDQVEFTDRGSGSTNVYRKLVSFED